MIILYIIGGLLLLFVLLFILSLQTNRKRLVAPFDRLPIAHRGLHTEDGEAPENSLAAFTRARQAGYAVEFDIQFTADRQIVVFHDATLKRICGIDMRVDELTYSALSELTLQGGQERIPLLRDILETLQDTPIVCEIKSYGANTDVSLCEAAWPLLSNYKGPLCIESFNPFMVRWFYKNHPEIVRGILSTSYKDVEEVTYWQGVALSALMTNFLTRPDFVAYDYEYRHNKAFRLCRLIYRPVTIAWTITDHTQEKNALNLFDNVIFE